MVSPSGPRFTSWVTRWNDLRGTEAIALVEFAVTLPLLIVLVVGVYDFGGAFNLRQKLDNITREAARFGSSLPTNDLNSAGTPPSVTAIRDLVDSYLVAAKIKDCGLASSSAAASSLAWTYTAASGCPGTLTLTIDRGNGSFQATGTGASQPINVISTHITISYPYAWQFNRVIGILVPGATYGNTLITTDAVLTNQD
jgi:Flp pilus assembly protein TadG